MYQVTVSGGFSAVHRVRLADGRDEAPHEHDWSVEVCFSGQELDSAGILVDFVETKAALAGITAQLEGADLNACPLLSGSNPTAERVARSIYQALARRVSRPDLLESVRVGEAPGCSATFVARSAG
jgi:6-pyruvoyltetrahydropterin/6-carboxytetrahydropterin synthase